MRTLHADLLTAQQSTSMVPYLYLRINSVDRSSRVLHLKHEEKPYTGIATVVLDNSDGFFTATELRGSRIDIGYGYNTASGDRYSDAAPLWAVSVRHLSYQGKLSVELSCIDLFGRLSLDRLVGGGYTLTGTVSGTFKSGHKVIGVTSGVGAVVHRASEGFISVVNVTPNPAGATTFTAGETVQMVNNTNVVITNVTQGAWNGGPGPNYAGQAGDTIAVILDELVTGVCNVVIDSSDGIVDTRLPYYSTQINSRLIDVFQDLLARTKSAAIAKADGDIHLKSVATNPLSPDYSYRIITPTHQFWYYIQDRRLALPNRIAVYSTDFGQTSVTPYSYVANDTESQTLFAQVVDEFVEVEVKSNAEAQEVAESLLRKVQMESTYGTIRAPINCGQELFDYVQVIDERLGVTAYGWVGSIIREYTAFKGVYAMELGLGGLTAHISMPQVEGFTLPIHPSRQSPVTNVPVPYDVPIASGSGTTRVELTHEGLVIRGNDALVIFRVTGLSDGEIYAGSPGLILNPPGAASSKYIYSATDFLPVGSKTLGHETDRWGKLWTDELDCQGNGAVRGNLYLNGNSYLKYNATTPSGKPGIEFYVAGVLEYYIDEDGGHNA